MKFPDHLKRKLTRRQATGTYRSLFVPEGLIDFCSNDYLGLGNSALLQYKCHQYIQERGITAIGATGSRLISGNHRYTEMLEDELAVFYRGKAALIFNSGYDANVGLLSCIALNDDVILYDELVHASIHDGIRLSRGRAVRFRHNDLNHLESLLHRETGTKYVVVESVYSMDGVFAPLKQLNELCQRYHAYLIVDEAHATGLYGEGGRGKVVECGIESYVFARIHTFGKALGSHGAVVIGSKWLKSYLLNYARSFIFTTALPLESLVRIKYAHDIMSSLNLKRLKISNLIDLFKHEVEENLPIESINSFSPIQGILIRDNYSAIQLSNFLKHNNFYVKQILYPTVPKGTERLRICLHAFNTAHQIKDLVYCIKEWIENADIRNRD